MASALISAFCRNHPDRQAGGICMRCGAPICGECTTKLEGVNHCSACLARRAAAARPRPARGSFLWVAAGTLFSFGFFWAMFFALGILFMYL